MIKNEDKLHEILENINDLVSHRFILVKPVLDQLLISLIRIARNDNFQFSMLLNYS